MRDLRDEVRSQRARRNDDDADRRAARRFTHAAHAGAKVQGHGDRWHQQEQREHGDGHRRANSHDRPGTTRVRPRQGSASRREQLPAAPVPGPRQEARLVLYGEYRAALSGSRKKLAMRPDSGAAAWS
jgi:hypothetical protein